MQSAKAQRDSVNSTPPPPSQLKSPKLYLLKASELPVYRSNTDAEITRMLLKEYIHADASGNTERCSVEYDNRGNITSISGNASTAKSFSYVYDANGCWSERIETINNSETSSECKTKEVRTFDDQNRVLTIDDYTYVTAKSEWSHSRSRVYDYVHDADAFSINDQFSSIGHCVKDITWHESSIGDGTVSENGFTYTWYEPLGGFIKCSSYGDSSKDEFTISDKGFVVTRSDFDLSAKKWVAKDKYEYLVNTPKSGYYTELSYSNSRSGDKLELYDQHEYSNNWYLPMINDGKPREKSDYDVNADGSVTKYRTKFGTWTKFPAFNRYRTLVEYYDGSYAPYYSDEYYDDEGNELFGLDEIYVSDDGSYVTEVGLNDGSGRDENVLYTLHNANGIETGKARRRNVGLLFESSSSSSTSDGSSQSSESIEVKGVSYADDVYEIYRDGEWKPWSGKHDVTENGNHAILDINENGYPHEVEVYEDGNISEKRSYTYSDNGYTRTTYGYDEDEKKLVKDYYTEVSQDKEGTITYISYEYDRENGSVMGADKTLIYKNGKIEKYDWNSGNGKFEGTPTLYGTTTIGSTDADGVTTNTTYNRDANVMVASSQSRSWVDADGSAMKENYKIDNGTLVKESKTVTKMVECPQFEVTEPSDPLKAIDTDATDNTNVSVASSSSQNQVTNTFNYSWDTSANDWKLTSKYETTFDVDDYSFTEMQTQVSSDGNTVTNLKVIKRDGSHRILENLSEQATSPNPNTNTEYWGGDYKYVTTYEYEGDNLTRKTISHTDSRGATTTETYQYIYESFTPSGIGNVANASSVLALVVNGRTVSAGSGKRVNLYSLDGKQVASGLGTVAAPVAGVYVVEVDGVKRKLMLK